MKPEIIALLSALGGILISQIGNIIVSIITKKREQEVEFRKLIFSSGIDQWKKSIEFAERQKKDTYIMPSSIFIVCNALLANLINKKKDINEKDIEMLFDKVKKIRKIVFQSSEVFQKETESESSVKN
jgi:hypothetical protein